MFRLHKQKWCLSRCIVHKQRSIKVPSRHKEMHANMKHENRPSRAVQCWLDHLMNIEITTVLYNNQNYFLKFKFKPFM